MAAGATEFAAWLLGQGAEGVYLDHAYSNYKGCRDGYAKASKFIHSLEDCSDFVFFQADGKPSVKLKSTLAGWSAAQPAVTVPGTASAPPTPKVPAPKVPARKTALGVCVSPPTSLTSAPPSAPKATQETDHDFKHMSGPGFRTSWFRCSRLSARRPLESHRLSCPEGFRCETLG